MAYFRCGGGNVTKVTCGTSTTLDIKSLRPDDYAALSEDNFIVEVVSVAATGTADDHINANNFSYGRSQSTSTDVTTTITKDYDADAGTLTISGNTASNSNSIQGETNTSTQESPLYYLKAGVSLTISFKVYGFIGEMEEV